VKELASEKNKYTAFLQHVNKRIESLYPEYSIKDIQKQTIRQQHCCKQSASLSQYTETGSFTVAYSDKS